MLCISCGHCCKTMSPVEVEGVECRHLGVKEDVFFCDVYPTRPQQCQDHHHPFRVCPIGLDIVRPVDLGCRMFKVEAVLEELKNEQG